LFIKIIGGENVKKIREAKKAREEIFINPRMDALLKEIRREGMITRKEMEDVL